MTQKTKGKDPAFLFYPADFTVGTMGMSYEQKGKYLTLLIMQHSKGGYLKQRDITRILDLTNEEDNEVLEKFKKTDEGFYYNQRLLIEITKRKEHSAKQRANARKRWDKEKKEDANVMPSHNGGNAKAMPLENENENKDVNIIKTKNKVFKKPTLLEIYNRCKEMGYTTIDPKNFFNFYESKGWMIGKNKMKDWKASLAGWESRNKKEGKASIYKPKDAEIDWLEDYISNMED